MKAKDESKVAGGLKRSQVLSAEERKAIAKKAADARWSVPQAKYAGEIKIGDMILPCSVLSDGTRILTQSSFMEAMGMYYSGWVSNNRSEEDLSADIPQFLSFKTLKPFVDRHLSDLQSVTVNYRTEKGNAARGIKAEIIPKICDVWLDADKEAKLGSRQKQIARQAEVVMRSLAHVGIIALVDEATGYQEIRDRDALQTILDKYLKDEWSKWSLLFPDNFYKQLFRLKGIAYPAGENGRKPSYVGHWTNDVVYSRLAPGVQDELKILNPRTASGSRKRKHHQHFTKDFGHPNLEKHIDNITFLMEGCSTWDEFRKILDKTRPKQGNTIEMDI